MLPVKMAALTSGGQVLSVNAQILLSKSIEGAKSQMQKVSTVMGKFD